MGQLSRIHWDRLEAFMQILLQMFMGLNIHHVLREQPRPKHGNTCFFCDPCAPFLLHCTMGKVTPFLSLGPERVNQAHVIQPESQTYQWIFIYTSQ